jgi:hypothetical protein
MAKRIRGVDLEAAVRQILDEYGEQVYDTLNECVEDVAQEAAERLQAVGTFAPGNNPTGEYSKSWGVERVKSGRLKTSVVVRNEEHYRLTHLLEKGHVSRNGTGRTFRPVPAYPHIGPVEEWANDELPKRVRNAIHDI